MMHLAPSLELSSAFRVCPIESRSRLRDTTGPNVVSMPELLPPRQMSLSLFDPRLQQVVENQEPLVMLLLGSPRGLPTPH